MWFKFTIEKPKYIRLIIKKENYIKKTRKLI